MEGPPGASALAGGKVSSRPPSGDGSTRDGSAPTPRRAGPDPGGGCCEGENQSSAALPDGKGRSQQIVNASKDRRVSRRRTRGHGGGQGKACSPGGRVRRSR